MADKTKNYGLTKPTTEEFYDINVQNQNMDKIDEVLKDLDSTFATEKTTLADADTVSLNDSADSNKLKKITWVKIKEILASVFSPKDHTHDASDINDTLPISKGGTGSTSATAAITNLGAAKANHKHSATDINSGTLSSDRLPVIPVTKGGTGASNSSQARANLGISEEYWTFTLEDGTTVTKLVCAT